LNLFSEWAAVECSAPTRAAAMALCRIVRVDVRERRVGVCLELASEIGEMSAPSHSGTTSQSDKGKPPDTHAACAKRPLPLPQ
jgi:hypothetical protein